jgi:hypothetical protein
MLFESILLIFLIATLVTGIRLYFDLQKFKIYKHDFDKILNKADAQLSDLEKITERFRYISAAEKDTFQRITDKAKTIKDDLLYLTERSENILKVLSSTAGSIKVDTLVEEALILDKQKLKKTSEENAHITSKKHKLIHTIKDLR